MASIVSKASKVCVCLDNGHAEPTLGKRSPDGRIREWKWTRDCVRLIADKLCCLGIETYIVTPETSQDIALSTRAARVNAKMTENQKAGKKTLFISVHVNAAGNGTQWMTGTGWEAYTTPGKTNSDKLADCLYDAAEEILVPLGVRMRTDMSDGDRDKEANFTVIQKANCPAVLTENMFMDNKQDVEFLLSYVGMNAIADVHVDGILRYVEKYI